MESVGASDGTNYELIPGTMGEDMVCLRAMYENEPQKQYGFIVPDSVQKNDRALYYKVEKIGSKVTELCGVREGDYVFVDALARFADTWPISFIRCTNVLFLTDADGKAVRARKGRVIAKIVEPSRETSAEGFISITEIDPYGEVVSVGEGCEERGISAGDRITVSSNADQYTFGGVKYFDYDCRVPMAKYVEDGKNAD